MVIGYLFIFFCKVFKSFRSLFSCYSSHLYTHTYMRVHMCICTHIIIYMCLIICMCIYIHAPILYAFSFFSGHMPFSNICIPSIFSLWFAYLFLQWYILRSKSMKFRFLNLDFIFKKLIFQVVIALCILFKESLPMPRF